MQERQTPVTEKNTKVFYNSKWYIAASSMQGWRPRMEDFYAVVPHNNPRCLYMGIFDGHGGPQVAQFLSENLHKIIFQNSSFAEGDIPKSIDESVLEVDRYLKYSSPIKARMQGSTAVIVIIKDSDIFCGNVGDSGVTAFLKTAIRPLSHPHVPYDPKERARILRAGFKVINDRVEGSLAMSRSIGDFRYKGNEWLDQKRHAVTPEPDVLHLKINDQLKYVALASDGIWEVLTSEQLGEEIERWINERKRPEEIVEIVFNRCLAALITRAGTDNMSLILAFFIENMSPDYKALLMQPPLITSTQIEEDPSEILATSEDLTSGLEDIISDTTTTSEASSSNLINLSEIFATSEASGSGLEDLSKTHATTEASTGGLDKGI